MLNGTYFTVQILRGGNGARWENVADAVRLDDPRDARRRMNALFDELGYEIEVAIVGQTFENDVIRKQWIVQDEPRFEEVE